MPRGDQRKPQQMELDRLEVGKLWVQGKSLVEIGHILGRPWSSCRNDLEAIREVWRESLLVEFTERKMVEAAHIDRIEAEAWEAWEKSKQPRRRTETLNSQGGGHQGGNVRETKTGIEMTEGNPAYLTLALKAVDRRIKLFGLDEPERVLTMSLELVKVYHGIDLDQV
jgi:hypothetical protein